MIDCKNVVKIFDRNTDAPSIALNHIDYQFPDTGLVGITGPSGSGKSTLLHCLSTLLSPTQGEIRYQNIELTKLSAAEQCQIRKNKFGLIFQKDLLIPYLDCLSNILVRDNDYAQSQRAKELMDLLGVPSGKYEHKYPSALSGGQRQRIAIARGLIGNPEVIFADEPTASLDRDSAELAMALFREISNKSLVIIVTHDMTIMSACTTALQMKMGGVWA